MKTLDTILREPSSIKPYENNPRHNDDSVDTVAASIQEFGFRQPIVVDKDSVIVIGHTRWKASLRLGLEAVPVHIAEDLTPEQIAALRIMDNKSHDSSEWDLTKLAIELQALADMDIDLELTGFDMDDIDRITGRHEQIIEGQADPDKVPPLNEIPERVKAGDVWIMGDHALICGDARDEKAYRRLLNLGKSAALSSASVGILLTDPPYNVDYEGAAGKIANDKQAGPAFRRFLTDALRLSSATMKPGACAYVFHADTEGLNFRQAFIESGFEQKQTLIWNKQAAVLGRQDYNWKHEPILYGWKPGGPHYFSEDFTQTTVWTEPDNLDELDEDQLRALVSEMRAQIPVTVIDQDRPTNNALHPTMKPVDLLVQLLKNSSRPGDLVLDNFAGSGSTLMAGAMLKRNVRLIELEPRNCDVIIHRWEEWSGDKARKG